MTLEARYSFDRHGTPGVVAGSFAGVLHALGVLHGRHRPLQSLLLGNAGTGRLAERLVPAPMLLQLDQLAHRLDLPTLGQREAGRLSPSALELLHIYLLGLDEGLKGARPGGLSIVHRFLPLPDVPALVSGFILSAYLGLAEGQARMERALIELVQAGAEDRSLEALFHPFLSGWSPEAIRRLPQLPPIAPTGRSSGSNAFAIAPERSSTGHALFAADPHLQIDQLPSLLFEVRLAAGDDYWLGATIPGLPALAVGRNREVAWSGTFAVADNVDHFLETLDGPDVLRADGSRARLSMREVMIGRRFLPSQRVVIRQSARGTLLTPLEDGIGLTSAWAGAESVAETFSAFLALWKVKTAQDAETVLSSARTMSLHFILADRGGDVRYLQIGQIPVRSDGWSGLSPATDGQAWFGRHGGRDLPRSGPVSGIVASANEARLGKNGAVLSTLAQPGYRLERIRAWLRARSDHDLESLKALQLDLHSGQGALLRPAILAALPPGPIADALRRWDLRADRTSIGAHAFGVAYRAALHGLRDELGGRRFSELLEGSELSVWWCAALDRALLDPRSWQGRRGEALARALAGIAEAQPGPYGTAQQFEQRHLLAGGLPDALGFNRGPFPLEGTIATVLQGNLVPSPNGRTAVGPAYRFVTDLGEDCAHSTVPGGIDGDPRSSSYTQWIGGHLAGEYHRLEPPTFDPPFVR